MRASILMSLIFVCSLPTAFSFAGDLEQRQGADLPQNVPRVHFMSHDAAPVDLMAFDHLDPQQVVPTIPLQRAVQFFALNKNRIKNQRYMTIVDLSQRSSKARMYVIDLVSGQVRNFWVAHGHNSDSNADGWATSFSNVSGSLKSSLGFYLTGGLYTGHNGRSMYLHGLESSNSNAYSRGIVMHGANYVNPGWAGRSFGCPAIERRYVNGLLPKLNGGSLLYVYHH